MPQAIDIAPGSNAPITHGWQARIMLQTASSVPPIAMRAWLDILRGAWTMLPGVPAPSEVVAMMRGKGGKEEEELAWLEALAGCLGAAVALARGQHDMDDQVRKPSVGCRLPCWPMYAGRVKSVLRKVHSFVWRGPQSMLPAIHTIRLSQLRYPTRCPVEISPSAIASP
jgi:hypothetical protein